jgi:hypothetical protein
LIGERNRYLKSMLASDEHTRRHALGMIGRVSSVAAPALVRLRCPGGPPQDDMASDMFDVIGCTLKRKYRRDLKHAARRNSRFGPGT